MPYSTVLAVDVDETLQALKARVRILEARIEQLERQTVQESTERLEKTGVHEKHETRKELAIEALPKVSDLSTDPGERGHKIPAINTSVTVGGRIKLEGIYNSRSVGGAGGTNTGDLALIPGEIPVETETDEDNQFAFSVRESRLWLKGRTPGDLGDLNAYFEMDFFAAQSSGNERVSNSHTPRLRHGYGTFGKLLFGQTWTTFMNVGAFPEHNDSTGPVAMINVRQPQIRWTEPFQWGDFQLALEEPETTLTDSAGERVTPDDDRFPDVVGKLSFHGDWGQFSIAGLFREIRGDGTTISGDESIGGAVNIAGRIKTLDSDNVRFSLSYGALGRYIALNAFNAGSIGAQGEIELSNSYGGFVSYQHWWTEKLRSTLSYSRVLADNDLTRVPSTVTEWIESYHANLIWSPLRSVSLGLEYIHAQRQLESGQDGELNRLQLTGIYNF